MSSGSRSDVGISHGTLCGIINIANPSGADRSNWEAMETLENRTRNYMFKSKHLKIIIFSISI